MTIKDGKITMSIWFALLLIPALMMAMFMAVVALHVAVIAGFTIYHLMNP